MASKSTTMNVGIAIEVCNVVTKERVKFPSSSWRVDTYAAKKPVKMFPTNPPIPWTAKISNASSMPRKNFTLVA